MMNARSKERTVLSRLGVVIGGLLVPLVWNISVTQAEVPENPLEEGTPDPLLTFRQEVCPCVIGPLKAVTGHATLLAMKNIDRTRDSLMSKLDGALIKLEQGKIDDALAKILSYESSVEKLLYASKPKIDPEDGQVLLKGAAAAYNCLDLQLPPTAGPSVDNPFAGDPRLEPIPNDPIHLGNVTVFGDGRELKMRFPPRVNGQTQSDGDKHADLFVLFYADGPPVEDQLAIVEAVPKNAAPSVGDFNARLFSAVWEMHAVTVTPDYVPGTIDSTEKLFSSNQVLEIFQTNIFLNCPVVPMFSTVDPGSPCPKPVFFDGKIVSIVPYDIEDGGFNPQILFKFENAAGNTLPSSGEPHLVTSRVPGDPFYSSIWELWTVTVPDGFDITTIRSAEDVKDSSFPIASSDIRLNCPVVAIETAPGSEEFDPFPFEDAFAMLENDNGRFNPENFKFDIPESTFLKPRTFLITEINPGGVLEPLDEQLIANQSGFPAITPDDKGNVIPLILVDPFQVDSSGPNTTGDIIRIDQAELDAAYANNNPPLLPAEIEANFAALIAAGLLDPSYAPGARPYQERLALVGRALHELVWSPEQGANSKDTTSCLACHSTPSAGGGARGLYTLERATERPDFGPPDLTVKLNPGSMFGSGPAEQLILEKKANGENVTFAHGSLGQIASIRGVISGARNAHFGIQTSERIAGITDEPVDLAAMIDLDGDGVLDESTVGEVTAETVFLMTRPIPHQAVGDEILRVLGVTRASVQRGKQLFRLSILDGGVGCASCHTPFHPLEKTVFELTNPQTNSVLPLQLSHNFANQDDVNEGLASYVGQPGLRTWGDFKKHEMGPAMFSAGQFGTDVIKTAELWDVGSVFPYLRDGTLGSDLEAVILAHGEEGAEAKDAFDALDRAYKDDIIHFLRAQLIEGKLGEGSGGEILPLQADLPEPLEPPEPPHVD